MARQLATLIPYFVGGLLIAATLMFALSLHQLWRGRTGPYWRFRRQASQRGGRLFIASFLLYALAAAIYVYSGLAAIAVKNSGVTNPDGLYGIVLPSNTPTFDGTIILPSPTVTRTPSAVPSPSPTVIASRTPTPVPTATSTALPSDTPTITPTETQTSTPTATFEQILNLTQPASARTPRVNASLRLTEADTDVSPDGTAPQPRTDFAVGLSRIYFFFSYQNMDNGVAWSRVLYRDGIQVQGTALLWSEGETGTSYFFFGNADGYPAGHYEARLFVGQQESSRLTFIIGS